MPIKLIHSDEAPAAIGPYSQAVEAGGFIFVLGQLPIDPATGSLINGGIEEQTEMVLKNLSAILKTARLSLENVVKCEVFLSDMNDFAKMNAVYARFFHAHKPARQAVEVSRLPKDVKIEISLIAFGA